MALSNGIKGVALFTVVCCSLAVFLNSLTRFTFIVTSQLPPSVPLNKNSPCPEDQQRGSSSHPSAIVHEVASARCPVLGLPQDRDAIPLPDSAFTHDRGAAPPNSKVGILDMQPPILLTLPEMFGNRVDSKTGKFPGIGNSRDTIEQATRAQQGSGVFIDVGGWIGDSSLPSAALGFDTYVFEPVRYNSNMMHYSVYLNNCTVSRHLTIVNSLVSDSNGMGSVFVTKRSDNAAATKAQAQSNVGQNTGDFMQPTPIVKLDSFFPPGTKVKNMKIDVQGYELKVLKGAERLLRENKGLLRVRYENDDKLLRMGGSSAKEVLSFMTGLGYKVLRTGANVDME